MQGYCKSQPLVLLWLGRRVVRVMRNGCGCSGGGSSAKACAWDEYINSGLCTASVSAWAGGGRPRRTLWVWDGCRGGVGGRLQAICRVRRGADVAGMAVGAATFAGRRADGGWQWKRFDGRPVCVWCGCGWNRVVDAAGGERKNLRGARAGLGEWLEWVRVSAKNHRRHRVSLSPASCSAGCSCQQRQAEHKHKHKHKHNSLLSLIFAVLSRSCLARLRI